MLLSSTRFLGNVARLIIPAQAIGLFPSPQAQGLFQVEPAPTEHLGSLSTVEHKDAVFHDKADRFDQSLHSGG